MDMEKMGSFLAELRKGKNLTQEELGEILGVTNKTISRWETGNYMPPVEMLEALGNMYGMSINELLSGKKLSAEEYKEMAEINIRKTLDESVFTIKEKQEYYKKKWRKEHWFTIVARIIAWAGVLTGLKMQGVDTPWIGAAGGMLAVLYYAILNNRMMAYVEQNIFGGKWNEY